MSFVLETVKNGKDLILYNQNKYRESYVVKCGDIVWRCLGRNCKGNVRTDNKKTIIYTANETDSEPHPITMRVLTPSPPPQRRLPLVTTPRPAGSSPFTTTSSSTPESASSTDIPPAPAPASPLHSSNTPATSSHKSEDSSGEISTLKNEITRLNNEMRGLLDHAIESDMRLLKFTDQIFVSDASISDNKENRPTTQDCSIRCDLPLNESSSEPIATRTYTDVSAQCDLTDQRAAWMELEESVRSLRGILEVLEAENHCLKLQLKSCKCAEQSRQPLTVIRSNSDTSPPVTTQNKSELLQTKNTKNTDYSLTSNSRQNKKYKAQKHRLPLAKHTLNLQSILIRGDSHTRHIAGLTRDWSTPLLRSPVLPQLTLPPASTVGLGQPASPPGPRLHCEVLIAGTNDLATGAQHTIYQHLEQYITNRPADTQLVVATMPHRHDLQDPDNPIHDETMLVNAFIDELAARHDIQVLRLDTISRKYFTRHGLHLSMRGKRLLAEMLVRCLTTAKTRPVCTDSRLSAIAPTPQPCTSRAVPPVAPPPVPTSPPLPSTPTPSLTLFGPASSPSSPSTSAPLTLPHITFAEVVAGTSKPNSIAETTSTQSFLVEAPPLIPIQI
ncbi:hypothetical protein J6590_094488 [Homalodisca vitripennis]|nr:hypothetical protein J6590_094488 [Homalodisca vitripennis]